MNEPERRLVGANAVISPDEQYRYCLIRRWTSLVEPNDTVLWVMLNPSTADAYQDDNTIRKITKFSKAWGYGALAVVNLFALRSRDPKALTIHPNPIGPDNARWIDAWMVAADDTIAGWGSSYPKALSTHVRSTADRLKDKGARVLGLTKGGDPRHPLFMPDSATPQSWT